MEKKKIALACFIGGVICAAVAFIFTPNLWWLGLFAGFASGYLSYEFRQVLQAIPEAWHAACRGSRSMWEAEIKKLKTWFAKPHPFVYPGALIGIPLFTWLARGFIAECFRVIVFGPDPLLAAIIVGFCLIVMALFILFFCVPLILSIPFYTLAFIGARVAERCYWTPFLMEQHEELHKEQLLSRGYLQEPLTYKNAFRWMIKGLLQVVLFFVWTLWKGLVIGICRVIWVIMCFLWHLFNLIHSKKRVLCGIDGTIGGMVAYLCFHSMYLSIPQHMLIVVFGGLLGAMFGVLNWEIVSKRILHVVPVNAT